MHPTDWFKKQGRTVQDMNDPHGLDLSPMMQSTLEIALVGTAMILLVSKGRRNAIEAVAILALAVIGRMLMEPIPNVQPVTVLVMLAAVRIGGSQAASIGILAAYLSNLSMGGGSWTVIQALSWASVGILTALLMRNSELCSRSFTAYTLLMGFVYGFLVSLPLGMQMWISGLPFDLLHAIGNLTIAVWTVDLIDRTLGTSSELKWVRPDLNRGLTAPSRQV